MQPRAAATSAKAAGHRMTFHVAPTIGPNAIPPAARCIADGPIITSAKAVSVTIVSATVSAIAIRRTRHHERLSVMWYALFSVSTIATIPEDVLQSAATRPT